MMLVAPPPPSTHRPGSQLASRVSCQLQASGRPALQELQVEERHGTVTLSGQVPTFHLKQLGQVIAGSVEGVARVCNQIVVAPTGMMRGARSA
jgi:osmotically-inducible protein OsmY